MNLIRSILSRALPKAILIEAKNGQEAIDKFKNEALDLIFMDIRMPILDGIAATRRIRALEESTGAHIPIIALSAGVMQAEVADALAGGMDHFISKPIDQRRLINLLQTL